MISRNIFILGFTLLCVCLLGCNSSTQVVDSKDPHLKRTRQGGLYEYKGLKYSGWVVEKLGDQVVLRTPVVEGYKYGVQSRFYASGELLRTTFYHQGKKEGPVREFYREGKLRHLSNYSDGYLHGDKKSWNRDGRLKTSLNYRQGRESGLQQTWTSQGEVLSNYIVEDGRRYGLFKPRDCNGGDSVKRYQPQIILDKQSFNSFNRSNKTKDYPWEGFGSQKPITGELPYYLDSDLTPVWLDSSQKKLLLSDSEQGRPFLLQSSHQSKGPQENRVVVSHFFFTSCMGLCPKLFDNLKPLDSLLGVNSQSLEVWSHSVTPEIDQMEILKKYQSRVGVFSPNWHFLRSDKMDLLRLAQSFYKIKVHGDQIHTENVYLVDVDGYIRGVYNGTRKTDILKLKEDISLLLS